MSRRGPIAVWSPVKLVSPLVPAVLRRLRWDIKTTRGYAAWLRGGGEHEAALLPLLCDRRLVSVDVGANLGGYTWLMRKHSRRVIAIEANPELARRLTRVCRATFATSVTVRNLALSDTNGTACLRIPVLDHGRSTIEGTNRLDGREVREVAVPMRRLDDLPLGRIGCIKIDVEGHELAVLRGAARALATYRPNLLIEATSEHRPDAVASVEAYLAGLDYRGWFMRDGELVSIQELGASRSHVENFVFAPRSDTPGPPFGR